MQTIQQAAAYLLKEANQPMRSKELVKIALEKNMIKKGSSKDPVHSLSQTLERNIRMNTGNNPKLEFVYMEGVRCIGLPEWNDKGETAQATSAVPEPLESITIQIPLTLVNKIKLHQLADHLSIEETLLSLIKKGLVASSSELLEKLKRELEDL